MNICARCDANARYKAQQHYQRHHPGTERLAAAADYRLALSSATAALRMVLSGPPTPGHVDRYLFAVSLALEQATDVLSKHSAASQ